MKVRQQTNKSDYLIGVSEYCLKFPHGLCRNTWTAVQECRQSITQLHLSHNRTMSGARRKEDGFNVS